MNENIGVGKFASPGFAHVILINHGNTRARLGWISASTGLTYCGLCLRAAITPEMGNSCPACGATVAHVFELGAEPWSLRNAWRRLGRQTTSRTERNIS
jgi:hypothetical protein